MAPAKVVHCDAPDCAYNQGGNCHALAIMVGDKSHPHCSTCLRAKVRGGDAQPAACVGACRMDRCLFNQRLKCQAPHIRVGHQAGNADCTTFRPK